MSKLEVTSSIEIWNLYWSAKGPIHIHAIIFHKVEFNHSTLEVNTDMDLCLTTQLSPFPVSYLPTTSGQSTIPLSYQESTPYPAALYFQ